MNGQEIRPSRWYYGVAVLVFFLGVAGFAWLLFKNLSGLGESLRQVVVPGKADLVLTEPGDYTVFYEYRSVVGSKVYSTEKGLSGLECTLAASNSGSKLVLSPASSSSTYTLGGREGVSMFEFRVAQPGTYVFSATYGPGKEGPEVVMAIGHDFTGRLVATILGGLGLFFGSFAAAVAIFLVTLIKRSKARKQLQTSSPAHRAIE